LPIAITLSTNCDHIAMAHAVGD